VPKDLPHDIRPHTIAVCIPVYGGESTLASVVEELVPLTSGWVTAAGHAAIVSEIVLAHDHGGDASDKVMRDFAARLPQVRTIWLTRNFGQHAATLAAISQTTADWVITMDEDGQHDPAFIGAMVDVAMADRASVVYGQPTNTAPHGPFRNAASKLSKQFLRLTTPGIQPQQFHSFRLILGSLARDVASLAGEGVYLDVALSWVAPRASQCPMEVRDEGDRRSGYSTRSLIHHFWRMVLTTGTRGLRLVSAAGAILSAVGIGYAVVVVIQQLGNSDVPRGWPSVMSVLLVSTGAILLALGVIAEYLGVSVNMSLGKPAFLAGQDPDEGPLGKPPICEAGAHGRDEDAPTDGVISD